MNYMEKYNYWLNKKIFNSKIVEELHSIEDDLDEIKDRFYKDLEFGTAGLRGKIGAGTNRMNIYTVAKAAQGISDTIVKKGQKAMDRGVVIAYDIRHKSKEFEEITASVLAANNIKVFIFDNIRSTPMLSYSILKLNTISGIMVTASHNPKEYNGYKVYWENGAQIFDEISDEIQENIIKTKYEDIKYMDYNIALKNNLIELLPSKLDEEYYNDVLNLKINEEIDKDIKIVYTPLNGVGNIPVRKILKERGFNNINIVKEQENPDPDFTTLAYPNPEDIRAFEYAIDLGKKTDSELLMATDPDSDRFAAMIRDVNGKYITLDGNQMGILLTYYIISERYNKDLPKNSAIVKSIVTGDMSFKIAEDYNVYTFESLTGFKNIFGEVAKFESNGKYKFLFGFEESIGYSYGNFVKDKDGIIISMLVAEMAAYYKTKGKTLLDIMEELYKKYGYYENELYSIVLEGIDGKEKMDHIMEDFRFNPIDKIEELKLKRMIDYNIDRTGLPKSNVLKYYYNDGSWFAIRPSGTEPKIKFYIYTKDLIRDKAIAKKEKIKEYINNKIF